jgi:hypothetical protein
LHKPDFCAASQFCGDGDAFTINTGTSAACGPTAGIVAALRIDAPLSFTACSATNVSDPGQMPGGVLPDAAPRP